MNKYYIRCIDALGFSLCNTIRKNCIYLIDYDQLSFIPSHVDLLNEDGSKFYGGLNSSRFVPWIPYKGDYVQFGSIQLVLDQLSLTTVGFWDVEPNNSGYTSVAMSNNTWLPVLNFPPKQYNVPVGYSIGSIPAQQLLVGTITTGSVINSNITTSSSNANKFSGHNIAISEEQPKEINVGPNCPTCGVAGAYIGFSRIECANTYCKHFTEKQKSILYAMHYGEKKGLGI